MGLILARDHEAMARLLTLLLVLIATLAETGVGNKEKRQGWSDALLALTYGAGIL